MPCYPRPRVDAEGELDELDDVLDQFSGPSALPKSHASQPTPASAVTFTPWHPVKYKFEADEGESELARAFSEALANEMASLMKQRDADAPASEDGHDETVHGKFVAAREAMLDENMDGVQDRSGSRTPTSASAAGSIRDSGDFQSHVWSAVDRLQESESGFEPPGSSANIGGDSLELPLSRFQVQGINLAGQSEGQLQGMMEGMGQLMSKEMLYEPLKELSDKFLGYLSKNNSTMSPMDKKRFGLQISCVRQLLDVFGAPNYRDGDTKARKSIAQLMGELQLHGSPPEEIVGVPVMYQKTTEYTEIRVLT